MTRSNRKRMIWMILLRFLINFEDFWNFYQEVMKMILRYRYFSWFKLLFGLFCVDLKFDWIRVDLLLSYWFLKYICNDHSESKQNKFSSHYVTVHSIFIMIICMRCQWYWFHTKIIPTKLRISGDSCLSVFRFYNLFLSIIQQAL